MLQCLNQNRIDRGLDYYQSMIEAIIEWRKYANQLYELNLNTEATNIADPPYLTIPVSIKFVLFMDEMTNEIYCCNALTGQSIQQRIIQKRLMMLKPSTLARFEDE